MLSLSSWLDLHTEMVYSPGDVHPSRYYPARRKVTSLIGPITPPLRHAAKGVYSKWLNIGQHGFDTAAYTQLLLSCFFESLRSCAHPVTTRWRHQKLTCFTVDSRSDSRNSIVAISRGKSGPALGECRTQARRDTIQKIIQNNWNFWTVNLIMQAKKLLTIVVRFSGTPYRLVPSQKKHWLLQSFNGLFFRTTLVSRHQKGKTNLDFTEARDSEWQCHQLGHMQVCTSLQTKTQASTQPLSFLHALPATQPTASKHWRQYI